MKYPKECPLFRDRDPVYTSLYEATDLRQHFGEGRVYGLTVREHYPDGHTVESPNNWIDINWLEPLTPMAREMLAAARGTR